MHELPQVVGAICHQVGVSASLVEQAHGYDSNCCHIAPARRSSAERCRYLSLSRQLRLNPQGLLENLDASCRGVARNRCPAQLRERLERGNTHKLLVFRCDRGFRCGGLGDRLSGILSGAMLALTTGRRFRIDWPELAAMYACEDDKVWPWAFKTSASHRTNISMVFINKQAPLSGVPPYPPHDVDVAFFASNRFELDEAAASALPSACGEWHQLRRWLLRCLLMLFLPLGRDCGREYPILSPVGVHRESLSDIARGQDRGQVIAFHVRVPDAEASAQILSPGGPPNAPLFHGYPKRTDTDQNFHYSRHAGSPLRTRAISQAVAKLVASKPATCLLATNSIYERNGFAQLAKSSFGCVRSITLDFRQEAHIAKLSRLSAVGKPTAFRSPSLEAALFDFHILRLADVVFMAIEVRVSGLSALAAASADPGRCQQYFDLESTSRYNYTAVVCNDPRRFGGLCDSVNLKPWHTLAGACHVYP